MCFFIYHPVNNHLIIQLLVQLCQFCLTLVPLGVGQTYTGDVRSGRNLVVIYSVIQSQNISVGFLLVVLLFDRYILTYSE